MNLNGNGRSYIASDGTIDLKEREKHNELRQKLAELIGGVCELGINAVGAILCYRAGLSHSPWSAVLFIIGLLLVQSRLKGNYIDDGRNDVYLSFNGHKLGRIFSK